MKISQPKSKPLQLEELHFEVDDTPYIIPTEQAYLHTKSTVEGLSQTLEEYRRRGADGDLDPKMRQLVMDALQAMIDEWGGQAREYEQLTSGQATITFHSLRELPTVLVKARLAAGLNQKQLAQKLGIKPQQLQRYEATRYRTITLERMLQIAEVLGVRVDGWVSVGQ